MQLKGTFPLPQVASCSVVTLTLFSVPLLLSLLAQLNAYPFVKEFIMQHRREYPQVRVNYVNGSPPSLTLITDDNDESDQLRMDSWKLEDILEFLQNTFKG